MTLPLVYFVNPMCSWCYGFHAGLEAALAARPGAFEVTLALGALREDTEPIRAEQRDYLRGAWTRVGEASGRPFAFGLLERDDFVYDTRPPSRALAAVRASQPDRALADLGALQDAFYRDNRDVTAAEALVDAAVEQGLDPDPIALALADPASVAQLRTENEDVARMGVEGYPTLVALTRPRPTLVTHGFRPAEALAEALDTVRAG